MADDREERARELLTSVNDAADALGAAFTRFLTVAVYIGITLASTTDERLVRGDVVMLPVLSTGIPMTGPLGFCFVAPVLIAILHLSVLAQLVMLGDRCTAFQAEVTGAQYARVSDRLSRSYYVRFLARGPGTLVGPTIVTLGGMVVMPLLALFWVQVRFLPLHDSSLTALQQLVIVADGVITVAILWRVLSIRAPSPAAGRGPLVRGIRGFVSLRALAVVLSAAVITSSIGAKVPDGREANDSWLRRDLDLEGKNLTQGDLLPADINTLRDGDPGERAAVLKRVSRLSVLQGLDLRHAKLARAILPAVDFRAERDLSTGQIVRKTQLEGADLRWAEMQQIMLEDADLRRAMLRGARIQGGVLARARLEGADLEGAGLQDAKLPDASLRGASLRGADLHGADLSRAGLRDADLSGANAQSAILREADLTGADLTNADLRGADLSGAHLQGTMLDGAQLAGAIVRGIAIRDVFDERCKLPDPAPLATAVQQVSLSACRDERALAGPRCVATKAVAATLAQLACGNPYVARGLSSQILYDAPGRDELVWALALPLPPGTKCGGMESLSDPVREELSRRGHSFSVPSPSA